MNYHTAKCCLIIGIASGICSLERLQAQATLHGVDQVMRTRVLYENSDLSRPLLILPSGDSVDASPYVRTDDINGQFIAEHHKSQEPFGGNTTVTANRSRLVSQESYRLYKDYLICLTADDVQRDLLVWKQIDSTFVLVSISPFEVFGDFQGSKLDTFAIGRLREDEGSVNGGYRYFTMREDTLLLVKEEVIQGNVPFDGSSNPVHGATTMHFYVRFFNSLGRATRDTLWYDCRNPQGDIIYAHAAGNTIDLYKDGYWGREYTRVEPDRARFRIGLSAFLGGVSYVYVEYYGRWYLTPRLQIVIEN